MLVSAFDFHLPEGLIADAPAHPRDSSRLLVVGDALVDRTMRDFTDYLRAGDVLVCNDTRVIPARLKGRRGEVAAEVTLHKHVGGNVWKTLARPARKLRPGDVFFIAPDFSATVLEKQGGEVTLAFSEEGEAFYAKLATYGTMPLPPYISREAGALAQDSEDYQTVYAKNRGAVAAPTAGLHFTESLLQKIDAKGVRRVFTTLHVGAGTFLPMKVDDTDDHVMHSEYGIITAEAADAINGARAVGGRVIAVGTTSLRILETVADDDGRLRSFAGETDIFITPGYRFKIVDCLLTNFHIPKSTLFMLVCAFAGTDAMRSAYAHAIAQGYRFYSYGDACFLTRADRETR